MSGLQQGECAHAEWLEDYITPVPDFPQEGVLFQWCGPLLRDPQAFDRAMKEWEKHYEQVGRPDIILGIESRGFFLGAVLADRMNLPFAVMRKPGKLPHAVASAEQDMEYGSTSLEIERGAIQPGDSVLIVDDVLATGGTAVAAIELVERVGGELLELACLIEIGALKGRNLLVDQPIYSLIVL